MICHGKKFCTYNEYVPFLEVTRNATLLERKKKKHINILCGSDDKEFACTEGDLGLIPELGRFLGGGHGNPLQYSYLGNPMDRGAWWAMVHGVPKS